MSRSPLSYPLVRPVDGEAGGVADLQTDVMRFMAILAICLVAIFALVQSIPTDPAPSEPVAEPEPAPEPVPEPTPEPEPEVVVVTRPAPKPVVEAPPLQAPAPAPEPPAPAAPESDGFTLQFETDLALTRLAARNEVALYAIGDEKSLRLSVNRGRLEFWPASTPNEYYEMETATVPADVIRALHLSRPGTTDNVQWGVTLPGPMRQQLNDFLETADGGSLLISSDGNLRLER